MGFFLGRFIGRADVFGTTFKNRPNHHPFSDVGTAGPRRQCRTITRSQMLALPVPDGSVTGEMKGYVTHG